MSIKGYVGVVLFLSVIWLVRAQQNAEATGWFSKPSELPKDVFDLPQFNAFRTNGKLDVAKVRAFLEALSDSNLPAAQKLFDIFSWQAFVALNSPTGGSSGLGPLNPDTPLAWESWQQTANVFLPDGQTPTWKPAAAPSLDHFKAGWRQFPTINEGKQAFSGPLIDQNGRWVHYVSLMNRVEFDYIVQNELYNLEGQATFVKSNKIEFPQDTDTAHGSIEIKLAWKFLTPAEVASNRFLVKRLPVTVYRPVAPSTADAPPAAQVSGRSSGAPPTRAPEPLGLVGMHIAMRTRSSPQWIWATFEQIDNTRLDFSTGDARHPLPAHPSLSNPDNPDALPWANLLPAYNASTTGGVSATDWDETIPMPPVEVLRVVPPPQSTQLVNIAAQAFLGSRNSPLRYYELNGTQWPKHPNAPSVPGGQGSAPESISRKMPGEVVPVYLTNSTMETYFQKGLQAAAPLEQDNRTTLTFDTTMVFGTESCVGCHYSAGACIGFRKDSAGKLLHDANGNKIPIFGENANGGSTANANFSWLLQLEARANNPKN